MKNKKITKLMLVVLVVAILFCSSPIAGMELLYGINAKANYNGYYTGTDIYTYEIKDEKVIITGCDTSVMGFFDYSGDVMIPAIIEGYPVTDIASGAFYGCEDIASITIPDSVVNIDDIFAYCKKLERIVVDENNQYFSSDSDGVLYNKDKTVILRYPVGKTDTSYEIADGVKGIGDGAFHGCHLKSVSIGDSVTSIGYSAFLYCSELVSVTIGTNVTFIDKCAFTFCNVLTEIVIPDGVVEISESCFSWCTRLKKITIPDSIKIIGDFAFEMCRELKDVYFSGSEKQWKSISIGDDNFYLTGLESIGIDGADIHFTEIRFDQDNYNVNYKGKLQISAETNIKTDKKINYVIDNPSVAAIDDEGNVTIIGIGIATVTATVDGTDISDTCTINVSYTWWQWIVVIVLFGWIWY